MSAKTSSTPTAAKYSVIVSGFWSYSYSPVTSARVWSPLSALTACWLCIYRSGCCTCTVGWNSTQVQNVAGSYDMDSGRLRCNKLATGGRGVSGNKKIAKVSDKVPVYRVSQNELSTDSEQAVSSKNLKVRAHLFFFRTRNKNIHFHAIHFVQNTARNAALTNMCVLVPLIKIFIIQSGDLLLCRNWKTIEGDSLLRISAQFVLGHSVYSSGHEWFYTLRGLLRGVFIIEKF